MLAGKKTGLHSYAKSNKTYDRWAILLWNKKA